MQVVPLGGQIWNKCQWRHMVGKIATNASGAIWWANLQLMQLAPSGGQIWNQYASGASGGKIGNQCNWCHKEAKFVINASGAIWWPRFTQVMESILWVRCASGNVFFHMCSTFESEIFGHP